MKHIKIKIIKGSLLRHLNIWYAKKSNIHRGVLGDAQQLVTK